MAYASVSDVKARAGRLRSAFGNAGAPDDREIQKFLDDVAGEIDARIGALGLAVPVVDVSAVRALAGVNADGAFLLAAPAAFPTEQAMSSAREAVAAAQKRFDRAVAAIDTRAFSAVALLLSAAASQEGASDFWEKNPTWNAASSVVARTLPIGRPDADAVQRTMSW